MKLTIKPDNYFKLKFEFSYKKSYSSPFLFERYKYIYTEEELINVLIKTGKKIDISLLFQNKNINVKWDNNFKVIKKLEININKQKIEIKRLAEYKDELRDDFVLIGSSLLFCSKTNKLGRLSGNGWEIFDLARKPFLDKISYNDFDYLSDTLEIKKSEFNNLEYFPSKIKIDAFLKKTNFMFCNNPIDLQKIDNIEYKFKLKNDEAKDNFYKWDLSFIHKTKEYNIFSPVKHFFANTEKEFKTLKTKNRKKCIAEILQKILVSKHPKKIIDNIGRFLSYDIFPKIQIRNDAKKYIKYFLDNFIDQKRYKILADNKGFSLIPYDFKKELSVLLDIFFIFQADIFQSEDSRNVLISKDTVCNNLSLFIKRMAEYSVEVSIENDIVKPVKLDFSFDITGNIDWFELRPEIYCKNNDITDLVWEKLFLGLTSFYDGKTMRIIDDESLDVIKKMSKLLGKKNKRKEKDYVKISRLQILDWIELKKMGISLNLPEKDAKIIESLLNFNKVQEKTLPEKFCGKLRDYQKKAYNWLAFHYIHHLGGCLADDMGLGKTIQVIAFMGGIKEGKIKGDFDIKGKNLIVVPASIVFNWKDELVKFYPDFKVKCYFGKDRDIKSGKYDILITTYDIMIRDFDIFKKSRFHIVVFDEAQYIKNIFSKRASVSRQIKADFKLCLTGTPLENHMGEYYSIMDISVPGLIGDDYKKFKKDLVHDDTALDVLVNRTKPFVLRRKKEDVLKDLPAKLENDVYLELTQHQRTLYHNMIEAVKLKIDNAYMKRKNSEASFIALTAILKLRQLCLSPVFIDDESKDKHSPKVDFLIRKLHELKEEGHCALIFSQFTSFLDIISKSLVNEKLSFIRLDGRTALKKREELVRQFQNSKESLFFLVSLKAGGVGLNLTRANYVFHMDPWWNPAVEAQAADRAHRIGQMKKVIVTRILMRHTIEDKMMYLKQRKLSLYEAILGNKEMQKTSNILSKEDFDFLLT